MPKPCDACHSSSAVVYCRADAAYLCVSCDGKVHGANKLASRHERVWMCEVCEVAPAVVTCKADAASLCVACDTDIHSANPLAQRHERVPVTPLYDGGSPVRGSDFGSLGHEKGGSGLLKGEDVDPSVAEAVSWLLPHPRIPPNAIIRGSAAGRSLYLHHNHPPPHPLPFHRRPNTKIAEGTCENFLFLLMGSFLVFGIFEFSLGESLLLVVLVE
jgi:hypothetical protein